MANNKEEKKAPIIGYLIFKDFALFKEEYAAVISDITRSERNIYYEYIGSQQNALDGSIRNLLSKAEGVQFIKIPTWGKNEDEEKWFREAIDERLEALSEIEETNSYITRYNQKWNVYHQTDEYTLIGFGERFYFVWNTMKSFEITYLKDYSSVTVSQMLAESNMSASAAIVPNGAITQQALESQVANQQSLLDDLAKEKEAIKNAELEGLKEIQSQIDKLKADLDAKKEALLAELAEKRAIYQQKMNELEQQVFILDTQIYSIRCFLGEVVKFATLKSGKNAPDNVPCVLHQKIRFLDEEMGKMCSLYDFDFNDRKYFEEFLVSSDFTLDTFCPTVKGISLVRVSKDNRTYGLHPWIDNMLKGYEVYHGKTIGIIIRNGENVYMGWTDDNYINIAEDMFYRPEVVEYYSQEDAEKHETSTPREIASRYCLFSILQGVLENTPILNFPGKHVFTQPDDMIIYSVADNWISDNRFGSFADIYKKYCEVDDSDKKVGDYIISTMYLFGGTRNEWGDRNPRGIGYANRTHDVRVHDGEIHKINHIVKEPHYDIWYLDSQDGQKHYSTEYTERGVSERIDNLNKKGHTHIETNVRYLYQFYVSLPKDLHWSKTKSDYKKLPTANFEMYGGEYINLTYLNSEWIKYVITTKNIGNLRMHRAEPNYAYFIKYLNKILEFLKKREAEEAEEISKFCNLDDYPEWMVTLSEWKFENKVHRIGPRAAKRFAKYLTEEK
ncbi:MAG: hypothetical protein IJ341_02415 [Bacteroidales bacterium]|nr:hypothetical protein [Bacteroidales bacterium]